jgi:hypothetical protein
MEKPKSKAELRAELEREINAYLHRGGTVQRVAHGISGQDALQRPRPPTAQLFTRARVERTPVNDVIAAIEARRAALRTRSRPSSPRQRSPRRRQDWLYDDFGEPLRRVWVEE